jgi:hypothetical protein
MNDNNKSNQNNKKPVMGGGPGAHAMMMRIGRIILIRAL